MSKCTCTHCDGTGRIIRHLNWDSEVVKCPSCNGTGINSQNQCKACGGTGTVWDPVEGMPKHCWACNGNGIKW